MGAQQAVRTFAWLVARLPFARLGGPGAALGFLAGSVLRIRRAHVEAAMARSGIADVRREAARMYRQLGRGALELFWLTAAAPAARERALASHVAVDPDAEAAFDAALARGPVVVGASHTGSWELACFAAARAARARGRRLAVVAKPVSSPTWDVFVSELRTSFGAELVHPHGAIGSLAAVLRTGGVVVMPIDQAPDAARHALRARFLGAPALLDRGPATVAARYGATMLVAAASRDGEACRLRVLATMAPREGVSARRFILDTTHEANAALEAFVRAHPASWLWLHRRWKDVP